MLDEYMEPYDVENTRLAARITTYECANWKLVLENNCECYHCVGSHLNYFKYYLEWDDTEDPCAPQDFHDHYNAQAAQWDKEGISHKLKSFGEVHINCMCGCCSKKARK